MLKLAETKALKLEDKAEGKPVASPNAKRVCTDLEKKLKRLPAGNLQLAQDSLHSNHVVAKYLFI